MESEIISPPESGKYWWYYRGLLLLVTLFAFFPALQCGYIRWDDPAMILDNPFFHDLSISSLMNLFTKPYQNLYQPLTILSLAIDSHFAGEDFFIFHFTNILFHLFNVLLVFELAKRLGMTLTSSFFVALLFAIHPSRVDSVAWITERKDVLFTFFYLLGLVIHMRAPASASRNPRKLVVFCFMLSIMSKFSAISFPFVLAIIDRKQYGTSFVEWGKRAWSFFLVILLLCLVTIGSWGSVLNPLPGDEYPTGGLLLRSLRVIFGVGVMVRHIIWPTDIPLQIPFLLPSFSEWPVEKLSWGVCAVFLCICLYWSRRLKSVQFGLCFFLVALIPVHASIFMLPTMGKEFTAIRHAYLPAFGLFFALVAFLQHLFSSVDDHIRQKIRIGMIALSLAGFGYMMHITRDRCGWYDDNLTFWSKVISQNPNVYAFINRGKAYFSSGRFMEARDDFLQLTRLIPDDQRGWIGLAAAELNLGHPDKVQSLMEKARKKWPDSPQVYEYLGLAAANASRTEEAIGYYSEALRLNQKYLAAWYNRSVAFRNRGSQDLALSDIEKVLSIDPDNSPTLLLKADILEAQGLVEKAREIRSRVTQGRSVAVTPEP
ncbi:MAG: tetratricopeptide repeat protein [Candidatus Riflebacteria bacterium]|nr:tetratricopeptide repeat protein [Candidatus Riflebacteria bacterium]